MARLRKVEGDPFASETSYRLKRVEGDPFAEDTPKRGMLSSALDDEMPAAAKLSPFPNESWVERTMEDYTRTREGLDRLHAEAKEAGVPLGRATRWKRKQLEQQALAGTLPAPESPSLSLADVNVEDVNERAAVIRIADQIQSSAGAQWPNAGGRTEVPGEGEDTELTSALSVIEGYRRQVAPEVPGSRFMRQLLPRQVAQQQERSEDGSWMAALESIPESLKRAGGGINQFVGERLQTAGASVPALKPAFDEVSYALRNAGRDVSEEAARNLQSLGSQLAAEPSADVYADPSGWARYIGQQAVAGSGPTLAGVGAGLLSGGIATPVFLGTAFGDQYAQAREEGDSPSEAGVRAIGSAAAEGIPEAIGGAAILGRLPFMGLAQSTARGRAMVATPVEAGTEVITEKANIEMERARGVVISEEEENRRLRDAALIGGAMGGTLGTTIAAAENAPDTLRRVGDSVGFSAGSSIGADLANLDKLRKIRTAREIAERMAPTGDPDIDAGAKLADDAMAQAEAARPVQLVKSQEIDALLTGGISGSVRQGNVDPVSPEAGAGSFAGFDGRPSVSGPGSDQARTGSFAPAQFGGTELEGRVEERPQQFALRDLPDGSVMVNGDPLSIRQRAVQSGIEAQGMARAEGVRFPRESADVVRRAFVSEPVARPEDAVGESGVARVQTLGAEPRAIGTGTTGEVASEPASLEPPVSAPVPPALRDTTEEERQYLGWLRGEIKAASAERGEPLTKAETNFMSYAREWMRTYAEENAANVNAMASDSRLESREEARDDILAGLQSVADTSPQQRASVVSLGADYTDQLREFKRARAAGQLDFDGLNRYAEMLEMDRETGKVGGRPIPGVGNKTSYVDALDAGQLMPVQAFLDADNFKAVNDKFGHDVGDDVIRAIGETLVEEFGAGNVWSRGGDEFLFQGMTEAEVSQRMERVRARMAKMKLRLTADDGTIYKQDGIGVSYGTGQNERDAEDRLKADKQARRAAGLRYERNESPDSGRVGAQPGSAGREAGQDRGGEVNEQLRQAVGSREGDLAGGVQGVAGIEATGVPDQRSATRTQDDVQPSGQPSEVVSESAPADIQDAAVPTAQTETAVGEPASSVRATSKATASDVPRILSDKFGEKFATRIMRQPWMNVVDSVEDLPPDVRNSITEEGSVAGFVFDGNVYIIAGAVAPSQIPGLVMHEVGVHFGLPRVVGEEKFGEILRQFKRSAPKDNKVSRAYERARRAGTPEDTLDEEAFAYYVEENWGTKAKWIDRITDAVKSFLNRLGIPLSTLNASPTMLRDMAIAAAHKAAAKPLMARDGKVMYGRTDSESGTRIDVDGTSRPVEESRAGAVTRQQDESKSESLLRALLGDSIARENFTKTISRRLRGEPFDYEIRRISVNEVTPSQSGEDYLNDSSRETARRVADGSAIESRPEDVYPIEIDRESRIVDGNHRHAAAVLNGDRTILALVPVSDGSGKVLNIGDFALSDDRILYSRTQTAPVGVAPAVAIESHAENLGKLRGFFDSAVDVLRRQDAFKPLAAAVERYYDATRRRLGDVNEILRPAVKGAKKGDFDAFEMYQYHLQNGRAADARTEYANMTDAGRALVDAWDKVAKLTNAENQSVGVEVFDPKLGQWRKIGTAKNFFPRMLKPKFQDAMRSPHRYPEEWNEMARILLAAGRIQSPAEMSQFLNSYYSETSASDYFAGLEKARMEPLPEELYDYSFDVAIKYKDRWAERVSQIEAFRQAKGKDAKDLFDDHIELTTDQATKDYIARVRDRAYNVNFTHPWARAAATLGVLVTGLQLGNPATALLNIMGGLAVNNSVFPISANLKAAVEMRNLWSSIDDAVAKGALIDDYYGLASDAQQMDVNQKVANLTEGLLTWGGFKATEYVNRTHAMLAGKHFLLDALRAMNKDRFSRKAKLAAAFLQRNGFDVDQLLAENGDTTKPETERWMRYAANLTQFSYKIDQAPVWIDEPMGRFLFKYQKFGTQINRLFWQQILKPFVDSVFKGGEPVTITDMNGQQIKTRVRSFWPIVQFAIVMSAFGLAGQGLRELLFGYGEDGPDEEEIKKRLADGETAAAVAMGAEKAFVSMVNFGAFGFWGNYAQSLKDISDRQRFKNPLDPPPLAPVKSILSLALKTYDQGEVTLRDINDELQRNISGYRAVARLLQTAGGALDSESKFVQKEHARREVNHARYMARRYASSVDLEAKRRASSEIIATANTPTNRAIKDALLLGDAETARALALEHVASFDNEYEATNALKSIQNSIRLGQPALVSAAPSESERRRFLKWLYENTTYEGFLRVKLIDEGYREAARKSGLWNPKNEEQGEKDDERLAKKQGKWSDSEKNRFLRKKNLTR